MVALFSVLLAALALGPPGAQPVQVRDLDGRSWLLLAPAPEQFDLVFFISTECPISNRYVPEIKRICVEYASKGVRCFAVYPDDTESAARRHRQEYELPPSIVGVADNEHRLVRAAAPRVTPEAALYSAAGRVYRGRIDDLYVDVGRSRRAATQHDLKQALEAVLAGRPVATSETESV
jgi:hypothetical protein